jgi:dephospho-CoA kinase
VKKLKILNTLIHPLVFNEIVKILDEKFPKIAIESVYFEDKFLNKLVDKILWVDRPVNKIKDCLIKKRGLRTDVANKILALDIIPKKIDLRINNNSTLKELQKKVIIAVEKF